MRDPIFAEGASLKISRMDAPEMLHPQKTFNDSTSVILQCAPLFKPVENRLPGYQLATSSSHKVVGEMARESHTPSRLVYKDVIFVCCTTMLPCKSDPFGVAARIIVDHILLIFVGLAEE